MKYLHYVRKKWVKGDVKKFSEGEVVFTHTANRKLYRLLVKKKLFPLRRLMVLVCTPAMKHGLWCYAVHLHRNIYQYF